MPIVFECHFCKHREQKVIDLMEHYINAHAVSYDNATIYELGCKKIVSAPKEIKFDLDKA